MGKGGICIHYTLLVVSEGVTAGRDLDRLQFIRFFYSLFGLVLVCLGGLLGEGLGCLSPHLSVPPGIPYCHSTPRPLTGAQIRDQGISVCLCVSGGCKMCVCVCVTEAVTSMPLCCSVRNLFPRGGRLEGET